MDYKQQFQEETGEHYLIGAAINHSYVLWMENKLNELIKPIPAPSTVGDGKSKQQFDICLWVHTDIDEVDTDFKMTGTKEEVQNTIDYINRNCLRKTHRLEIMESDLSTFAKEEISHKIPSAMDSMTEDEKKQFEFQNMVMPGSTFNATGLNAHAEGMHAVATYNMDVKPHTKENT